MTLLCFMGSTLTFGRGDREALGWAGRLTRQLVRERRVTQHFNLGVPDETMPVLARRAERECRIRLEGRGRALIFLEPGHADLAILSDGTRRTDATTFEAHVRMTASCLAELGEVVLVGPGPLDEARMPLKCPATGDEIRYTNSALGAASNRLCDIAEETGSAWIDLFTPLSLAPAWLAALEQEDGLAPSGTGHKMIADLVHPAVVELLEMDDG